MSNNNPYNLKPISLHRWHGPDFEGDLIAAGLYELCKLVDPKRVENVPFEKFNDDNTRSEWLKLWDLLGDHIEYTDSDSKNPETDEYVKLAEIENQISNGTYVLFLTPYETSDSYEGFAIFKNGKCEYYDFPKHCTFVHAIAKFV